MELNFFLLQLFALFTATLGKHIFCYYSSFAQNRKGVGKFLPEDINPHICTHLIYAFVHITSDGRGLRPFNKNDLGHKGLYARTLALKKINPDMKVLLAVGGWQIGSKPFIPMIQTEETRSIWIRNVVKYLRKRGFDGLDMDWEFPATRGSAPDDKFRFTALMKGLYEAFQKEAEETGKEKLLLTLATASGTYYINQSYEPHKIINYLDFMLLMTYNYHGQWEKKTGHHSGLYPHKDDPKYGEKSQLYQEWSIDYWLSTGISKDKLVVGIPTYGMTFTLADESKHGIHSPAIGGGQMGQYTKETGILSYFEICVNLRDKGWTSEWIDDQMVSYAYSGDQWVGYEDRRSMAFKAANIVKRDLAGAFVWSVEMDDFNGICGEGQYPLLSTLSDALGHGPVSQTAARERVTPIHTDATISLGQDHADFSTTPAPSDVSFHMGVTNAAAGNGPIPTAEKVSEVILSYSIIRKNKSKPTSAPRPKNRNEDTEDREVTKPVMASKKSTEGPNWLQYSSSQEIPDFKAPEEGHRFTSPDIPKPKKVIKLEIPKAGSSSAILKHKTKDLSLTIPHWIKPAASDVIALPSTKPSVLETMTSKYGEKNGRVNMWWARHRETSKAGIESSSGVQKGQHPRKVWWKQNTSAPSQVKGVLPSALNTKDEMKVKAMDLPSYEGYYVIGSRNSNRWWASGAPQIRPQGHEGKLQKGDKAQDYWAQRKSSSTPGMVSYIKPDSRAPYTLISARHEVCRDKGFGTFADPLSCEHFIMCLPGNWMDFPPPVMACPTGTRFDDRLKVCNYASDVTCLR